MHIHINVMDLNRIASSYDYQFTNEKYETCVKHVSRTHYSYPLMYFLTLTMLYSCINASMHSLHTVFNIHIIIISNITYTYTASVIIRSRNMLNRVGDII